MVYRFFIMLLISSVRGYLENDTFHEFDDRIYYGFDSNIEQYPHAVFLLFETTTPSSCGGSLIMVQAILTAAHCIDDFRYYKGKISAYLGATVPIQSKVARRIIDYEINPSYDERTGRHNMAVAFMSSSVPLQRNIKKIPLAVQAAKADLIVFSVGWGKQKPEGFTLPDFSSWRSLKGTRQRVLDRPQCTKFSGFKISPPLQCSVSEHGHFYKDDSGDGLVAQKPPILVGVLSFVADGVSIFTAVDAYHEWISDSCYKMYRRNCAKKRIK